MARHDGSISVHGGNLEQGPRQAAGIRILQCEAAGGSRRDNRVRATPVLLRRAALGQVYKMEDVCLSSPQSLIEDQHTSIPDVIT